MPRYSVVLPAVDVVILQVCGALAWITHAKWSGPVSDATDTDPAGPYPGPIHVDIFTPTDRRYSRCFFPNAPETRHRAERESSCHHAAGEHSSDAAFPTVTVVRLSG